MGCLLRYDGQTTWFLIHDCQELILPDFLRPEESVKDFGFLRLRSSLPYLSVLSVVVSSFYFYLGFES